MTATADQDAEQLKLSSIATGNGKCTTTLQKSLAVSYNLSSTLDKAIILLFKRSERICPQTTCTRIS